MNAVDSKLEIPQAANIWTQKDAKKNFLFNKK